jgi:hypothetical protein
MAGGEVLRRAFGHVAARRLDPEVDRLVVAALRAAAPGPGGLLLDAGQDAGLDRSDAIDRASTCFLAFSAFNLSDDLSDGDCTYLPPAPAQAVVLILNSIFLASLRDLHLSCDAEANVHRDLLAAEEAQVLELGSAAWDAERLRVVTDGIAGRQWAAYLRVMWAGSPREHLSTEVAVNIGRVGLLADDISCEDPRFASLPPLDRRAVLEEALTGVRALESVGARVAHSVVAECQPVIAAEIGRGS